jgi:hypothetical protein
VDVGFSKCMGVRRFFWRHPARAQEQPRPVLGAPGSRWCLLLAGISRWLSGLPATRVDYLLFPECKPTGGWRALAWSWPLSRLPLRGIPWDQVVPHRRSEGPRPRAQAKRAGARCTALIYSACCCYWHCHCDCGTASAAAIYSYNNNALPVDLETRNWRARQCPSNFK